MSDDQLAQLARDVQAVRCVSPAGGVVAMRPLLVHASSKAETDLRADSLQLEGRLSLTVA
jgi:hypothetical protein